MQAFKTHWEIQHNWQLIFPFLGLVGLFYSSYKLVALFNQNTSIIWIVLVTIMLFFLLLKITLFLFKKLESKWELNYKWEMIRVFIVFAVTGSSSVLIGRPFMVFLGITKENLNPIFYWVLFTIIGLIFYQILLVFYGWLFGQFQFFWSFEKKMLRRFGVKI
jgi:small-conductance mechanosensitive channel